MLRIPASMGPRLFSRGNISKNLSCLWRPRLLQWGHDFSAVEIVAVRVTTISDTLASMGPRLFSRGNSTIVELRVCGWNGFNGATTFQPWKCGIGISNSEGPIKLQWGHDFSAVEIGEVGRQVVIGDVASMGPRLFSRGNLRAYQQPVCCLLCFNGATTFQPWKWSRTSSNCQRNTCFNGATTFQPWKFCDLIRCLADLLKLQWGHDFSAVEISPLRAGCWRADRFNGATTFQPWKYIEPLPRLIPEGHASMGPRLFSRGNTTCPPSLAPSW